MPRRDSTARLRHRSLKVQPELLAYLVQLLDRLGEGDRIARGDQAAAAFEQRSARAVVEVRSEGNASRSAGREQVAREPLGDRSLRSSHLGDVEVADPGFGERVSQLLLKPPAEPEVFKVDQRTRGLDAGGDKDVLLPPGERHGTPRKRGAARAGATEEPLKLGERPGVRSQVLERLADRGDRITAAVEAAELVVGIVEAVAPGTERPRSEVQGSGMEPQAPDRLAQLQLTSPWTKARAAGRSSRKGGSPCRSR